MIARANYTLDTDSGIGSGASMDRKSCLHCRSRRQDKNNGLGLCTACNKRRPIAHLYNVVEGRPDGWGEHLERLADLARQQLPLADRPYLDSITTAHKTIRGAGSGGPGSKRRLSDDDVMEIRELLAAGMRVRVVAKRFKVWPTTVNRIRKSM